MKNAEDRNGRRKRRQFIRSSPFAILHSHRRGSVLVLVMTLLGILFVLGVAFLATMNFEADMIAFQRQRDRADNGVAAAAIDVGSMLRDSMMAAPGLPFGDTSVALSSTAYAEMPGVQNASSPVEPIPLRTAGPNGIFGDFDDVTLIVFNGYFDPIGLRKRPFVGPSLKPGFYIDTDSLRNGDTVNVCNGGPRGGQVCVFLDECPSAECAPATQVADADGDGIVDSLLVDAADIGLSGPQLTELAARVNPASNPTGRVSIALRVIAHGGMVNINDSHPNLIENVLGIPAGTLKKPPDPNLGNFFHSPTQLQTLYSPMLEETPLRRRALLPPAVIPSSMLVGNALLDKIADPTGKADMAWYLYPPKWPGGAVAGNYETVFDHRYTPFAPGEPFPGNVNYDLWPVRMEPFTANAALPPTNPFTMSFEYDRRHLVTTVSQDDLLTRGGTLTTPTGSEDLRQTMIEANQSAWDPNQCPPVLPFEYADYPPFIKNETDPQLTASPYDKCECPTDLYCRFDPRKGRLQLSLPWIDDALADAAKITDPKAQEEARQHVFHTIHDAFFMLVRNAAAPLKVEGTLCSTDADCPVRDTVCLLKGVAPGPLQQGYCVHNGNSAKNTFTDPNATGGPGCQSAVQCAIPGSTCNRGVCELAAPAWRDKQCVTDNDCNPPGVALGEQFCPPPPASNPNALRFCADRWTKQRRSEALIARTAASLTANMIDFADADNVPTRVAIRDFEFIAKCKDGGNQNRPCASDTDCPVGSCRNLSGREIDVNPSLVDKDNINVYAYGLERQPYITEVATLATGPAPYKIDGRAIEVFNPYPLSIPANNAASSNEYFIYQVDESGSIQPPPIALTNDFQGSASPTGPFTVYYSAVDPGTTTSLLEPPKGVAYPLGATDLKFGNKWTLYLVRRVQFPDDPAPTDIVIDQFKIEGTYVGVIDGTVLSSFPPGIPLRFSVERAVQQVSPWTAPVPFAKETAQNAQTLGTWNSLNDNDSQKIYPVEIQFANTGTFGPHIFNTNVSAAFPTTGSLSLLIRYANRAITDFTPPVIGTTAGKVTNLAFTSALRVDPAVEDTASIPVQTAPGPPPTYLMDGGTIRREEQIDNGRMPLFDVGVAGNNPASGKLGAHHLPPQLLKAWDPTKAANPLPGNLNTLPWGQLVFDYFTALPLSNPGPYLVSDPNMIGLPESQPRVDREGARVYGRINLNAAPWTVLSGLPLVPMNRIPTEFRARIEQAIFGSSPIPPTEAGTIGPELAQAIAAYREARDLPGTGNYNDGTAAAGVTGTPPLYPRGWTNANPVSRRGTGLMGVGELANVRHSGAAGRLYKIDSGMIGSKTNKNEENFIDAAAVLIALGDWATVRSQVFTVYGLIRGESDPNAATGLTGPPANAALVRDADSRAIRFQETIDRLPTFFGEPLPRRIGTPTVAKLTDVNND